MAENNAVVRVYDPHAEVEATIKEFQSLGFDMNRLPIVGRTIIPRRVSLATTCRQPNEGLVPVRRLLRRISRLVVGVGVLFYSGHRSRHSLWPAGQLDCQ